MTGSAEYHCYVASRLASSFHAKNFIFISMAFIYYCFFFPFTILSCFYSLIHSLISVDLWARASPQLNLWFDWNASSGCTYFFSPNNTTLDNGWQPKVFHQQMKSESEKRHVHIHQFFSPTNTTLNNGKYFISRWKVKVKSERSTYNIFLFTN